MINNAVDFSTPLKVKAVNYSLNSPKGIKIYLKLV